MQYITIQHKNNYAVVQLKRGKVNAINHQVVNEIRQTFQQLKDDDTISGVIFTGIPHFFSAGLDVKELFHYDKAQIADFFKDFVNMFVELMNFPKLFISAITGHSPAGGCVIAITSDYRIMATGEKYVIGLNEVAVNILISKNIAAAYAFWIGERRAYQALLQGRLFDVQTAYDYGLLDEISPLEEVLKRAEGKMKAWLQHNPAILQGTKRTLRQDLLEQKINLDVEELIQENVDLWWEPSVRAGMQQFVENLSRR